MSASAAVTLEGLLALAEDPARLAEVRPVLRLLAGLDDDTAGPAMQSTAAAASRLGFTTRVIEKWCREGRMPGAIKLGATWRVPVDSMPGAPPAAPQRPAPTVRRARPSRPGSGPVRSSVEDAIRGPQSGRVRRTTATRSAPASAGTDRGRGPMERDSMDKQHPSAARTAGATVTPITSGVTR